MTWVDKHPERIERIRAYVSDFQAIKPSLLDYFQGGSQPIFPLAPESDRGVALLLCFCSLYQKIGEEKLIRILAYLWRHYGTDIFRLNKLPFAELQARMQILTDLDNWPIWAQSPGILRSVGDFFYRHGKLLSWVYARGNGEACVTALCDEIFLMGKTSPFKTKARYFLWLLTQLEGVRPELFWSEQCLVPISRGHIRFLREFGPLKKRKTLPWEGPEEKLRYFNRFYRMLFPGRPWQVFAALDAYLKPHAEDKWVCRKKLGGCARCPLVSDCPGKEL